MSESPKSPSIRAVPLSRWLVGGLLLLAAIIGAGSSGFGGFLVVVGVSALVTGIVAVTKRRRTWAGIPSRSAAMLVTAVGLVVTLIGGGVYGAQNPKEQTPPLAAPTPSYTAPTAPTTHEPETDETPLDPETTVGADTEPSVVIGNASTTSTTAMALLETLPVKGRAPKTGYDRTAKFGTAWVDVDRNGCDTRNDILARDLTDTALSGRCKVLSGVLADPYTGKTINFLRGNTTSTLVQIDHVVALLDAWQKGAQQLTQAQRVAFANDPMNLFATDGPTNAQKGAGDAATWLPPNKTFRCEYVARQVSVKATYGLWITSSEKEQIARVLSDCDGQMAYTSAFTPPAPPPAAARDKAHPSPEVCCKNCTAVRAAGAAPIRAGQPGYGKHLDRDGDGVGCE